MLDRITVYFLSFCNYDRGFFVPEGLPPCIKIVRQIQVEVEEQKEKRKKL